MKHALRKPLTMLGMSVIAIVMSFAVSSPALAADFSMQTNDSDPGGKLYWTAYGDIVTICDQEADGWAVEASIGYWINDSSYGTEEYEFQVGGNGECATRRANDGATWNLSETKDIFLKVCLDKASTHVQYCDTHVWRQ